MALEFNTLLGIYLDFEVAADDEKKISEISRMVDCSILFDDDSTADPYVMKLSHPDGKIESVHVNEDMLDENEMYKISGLAN